MRSRRPWPRRRKTTHLPPRDEAEDDEWSRSDSLRDREDEEDDRGRGRAELSDGDVDDGEGDPRQIEQLIKIYRAKKLLTASKGFFELLEDNTFPEKTSKLHYYLARSLFDLKAYHTAQHYFMQVVRKGPKNPYFKYALPRLVAIAQLTGDDTELLRIVTKVPPDAYPRQAKNHLFYLAGRKLYDKGEMSDSAKYFRQVSTKSELYLRSKYFEGIINNRRGKLKSSVKAFREVYQSTVLPTDSRSLSELEDLKDLSLINIARIYYGLQRFDQAEDYYKQVERSSLYWPESLFERAWTHYFRNDLNYTLGLLLTVNSPYFHDEEFIPEATVLRALTFFTLCEYDQVERILLRFEAEYRPVLDELKGFIEQYDEREEQKLAASAYDAYFTDNHPRSKLSKSVFNVALRNRDLAGVVRHLELMDDEERLINSQKSVWRDSIGAHLKKVIEKDRMRLKTAGGKLLLQELTQSYRHVQDLMTQSEIIRFEVVDAQARRLPVQDGEPGRGVRGREEDRLRHLPRHHLLAVQWRILEGRAGVLPVHRGRVLQVVRARGRVAQEVS